MHRIDIKKGIIRLLPYIIIIIIIGIVYLQTIFHEFVWDDKTFIFDWNTPHSFSLTTIIEFFKGDLPEGHQGGYRPIRNIFYLLLWKIAVGAPWYYHLQAIILHTINSILLYNIARLISLKKSFALLAAITWALLPLNVEAVAFVTAGFDLYGALFFFLSLLFFLYYCKNEKIYYFLISWIFLLFATFSYELTLLLPVILTIFLLQKKDSIYKQYRPFMIIILFIPLILHIAVRVILLGIGSRGGYVEQDPIYTWIISLIAFGAYIKKFLFPFNLAPYTQLTPGIVSGEQVIGKPYSYLLLFSPEALSSILLLVSYIVGFILSLKYKKILIPLFIWFIVTLVPILNIIPGSSAFADRYFYLSGAALIVIIFYFLQLFIKKTQIKFNVFLLLYLIFTLFIGTVTYKQIQIWKNEMSLWTNTSKKVPTSASAFNNLGFIYLSQGDREKALNLFQEAVVINPSHGKAWTNIGATYAEKQQYTLAQEAYKKATILLPEDQNVLADYAVTLIKSKKIEEGKKILEQVALTKRTPQILFQLSNIYARDGDIKSAILLLEEIRKNNPNYSQTYNNLGALYLSEKKYDEAISIFIEGSTKSFGDIDLYVNLANAYIQTNRPDLAKETIEKALQIDPHYSPALEISDLLKNK